jgi:hypothetical protein
MLRRMRCRRISNHEEAPFLRNRRKGAIRHVTHVSERYTPTAALERYANRNLQRVEDEATGEHACERQDDGNAVFHRHLFVFMV